MKTLSILTLIACLIMSCNNEPNLHKKDTGYSFKEAYGNMEIVIVDSCEYLYGKWGSATVLTHKGNCKNTIHYGK